MSRAMNETIPNAKTTIPPLFDDELEITLDVSRGVLIDAFFDDVAFNPECCVTLGHHDGTLDHP